MLVTPTRSPLRGIAQLVHDWSVASQQQARRNAMIATTACAQRRIERQDVADYLDGLATPATGHDRTTEPAVTAPTTEVRQTRA